MYGDGLAIILNESVAHEHMFNMYGEAMRSVQSWMSSCFYVQVHALYIGGSGVELVSLHCRR